MLAVCLGRVCWCKKRGLPSLHFDTFSSSFGFVRLEMSAEMSAPKDNAFDDEPRHLRRTVAAIKSQPCEVDSARARGQSSGSEALGSKTV